VLLYLGSLGTDYLLKEMIALFRQLLQFQPQAYFLFVSNNGEDLVRQECANQGVSADRIRFTSTSREFVPAHIALADLSVVFIRPDHTKVGCSPTKLAELFACNIPVIANSGVGDLDTIIDPSRNASVLVKNFSDSSLLEALKKVTACRALNSNEINIRENTRAFAHEESVARYSGVYRELLNTKNQGT
jgi:glycosyltransferase involved in cell wall biosynthesis